MNCMASPHSGTSPDMPGRARYHTIATDMSRLHASLYLEEIPVPDRCSNLPRRRMNHAATPKGYSAVKIKQLAAAVAAITLPAGAALSVAAFAGLATPREHKPTLLSRFHSSAASPSWRGFAAPGLATSAWDKAMCSMQITAATAACGSIGSPTEAAHRTASTRILTKESRCRPGDHITHRVHEYGEVLMIP